jgi:hypothetical protein
MLFRFLLTIFAFQDLYGIYCGSRSVTLSVYRVFKQCLRIRIQNFKKSICRRLNKYDFILIQPGYRRDDHWPVLWRKLPAPCDTQIYPFEQWGFVSGTLLLCQRFYQAMSCSQISFVSVSQSFVIIESKVVKQPLNLRFHGQSPNL